MKIPRIGLLVCSIVGCHVDGHYVLPDSPTPEETFWVRQLGSGGDEFGKGIAIDNNGDLIAVGSFEGTIVADSPVTSNGNDDLYVLKLSSTTGSVIWVKRFGGLGTDRANSIAIDSANNIYVTGAFLGSIDFGSGPLMSEGDGDGFVLKLAANGDLLWVKKVGGTGSQEGTSIFATDTTVVVGGFHHGSMTVDTTTISSIMGSVDFWVLSLDAQSSTTNWVRSFGGDYNEGTPSVAIDDTGNIAVASRFKGSVNFGGNLVSSLNETNDIVLLKLASANGAHLFSKRFGGAGNDNVTALAIDSDKNIILTGHFEGAADFGCSSSLVASQANVSDIFLARYSQAGSCLWAKSFGGAGAREPTDRQGRGIAINRQGDVAITGGFCGSMSFGGPVLVSASECPTSDVFAARFAGSDGRYLTSVRAGGTGAEVGDGVAQSSDGRFFVTGTFSGFAEFGRDALASAGAGDAFVLAIAPL